MRITAVGTVDVEPQTKAVIDGSLVFEMSICNTEDFPELGTLCYQLGMVKIPGPEGKDSFSIVVTTPAELETVRTYVQRFFGQE